MKDHMKLKLECVLPKRTLTKIESACETSKLNNKFVSFFFAFVIWSEALTSLTIGKTPQYQLRPTEYFTKCSTKSGRMITSRQLTFLQTSETINLPNPPDAFDVRLNKVFLKSQETSVPFGSFPDFLRWPKRLEQKAKALAEKAAKATEASAHWRVLRDVAVSW